MSAASLDSARRRLVRCRHVISMDGRLGDLAGGEILIDDGRIAAVGTNLEFGDAEAIDASTMVALPGFIDVHRHTWQTAVRHCAVGWDLSAYQQNVQGVVGNHFTPEDAYIGNLLGALSAIDAGITTLRDESHVQNSPEHTNELIRALKDSGIRATFAYGWPSTNASEWLLESTRTLPDDIRRVRTDILSDDNALVTLNAHLRGPELSTIKITRADVKMARELGLRISMHMGTGEFGQRFHGIAALEKANLIGPDMTFVHCCTSNDAELDMIARTGATACVTPAVEATMPGLGAPATGRLLAHGVRPSLGIDVEVGTAGDMFNVMRAALMSERLQQTLLGDQGPQGVAITPHDLLEFATVQGAIACGLANQVGSISPGKQADIILVRGDDLNLVPGNDWAGSLVAAGHAGNIDTVLIGGQVLKRGGRLTHTGIEDVLARARASGTRLLGLLSREAR